MDRVLLFTSDLSPNEFDESLAVRADNSVLVIRSIRESGATDIDQFAQALRSENPVPETLPGEIAVIGSEDLRDRFGRKVPADVEALLFEAEDKTEARRLTWAGGYEGLYVLSTHVSAEK
ncbi:hypothetical protein [Marinobacter salarius]|nr:hypothetical protein [Marinobacter salarius]